MDLKNNSNYIIYNIVIPVDRTDGLLSHDVVLSCSISVALPSLNDNTLAKRNTSVLTTAESELLIFLWNISTQWIKSIMTILLRTVDNYYHAVNIMKFADVSYAHYII